MKKRKRRNNISLMELLTFGLFLLALLTFVFTFYKYSKRQKFLFLAFTAPIFAVYKHR